MPILTGISFLPSKHGTQCTPAAQYRPNAPTVFHEMVKEESSLPWEAKGFDSLELPGRDQFVLDWKLSTV
jgi:hypothetical protein